MSKNTNEISGRNNISLPSQEIKPILFGSILKEHRKKAGYNQRDFAAMLNVTRNTIINWEADKSKPDYAYIPLLCSMLDIPLHELFGMPPENGLTSTEDRVIHNFRQLPQISQRVVDKMIFNMLEEESAAKEAILKGTFDLFMQRPGSLAAGMGNYVPEEPPAFVFLRKNHINAKADGIALVDGDSMEPVYHSGDYVYYEETSAASPGEDVIVDTDDGAVIKRVDDDYTLYSVNPAIPYPKKNEHNTLVIRGRVLGVVSSSDRPDADDLPCLQELFAREIKAFNEEHGLTGWE